MSLIDFNKPSNVHFIGIGGISMSGLAEVLLGRGFNVTGSDNNESDLTRHLEKLGARIFYGQKAENVSDDYSLVVYTAAIHPDNPEFAECVRLGLPMMTRAELLGELMANYPVSFAVAGTHGKTTTTSMLSEILMAAKKDPTISVGGILPSIGGNIRVGSSDCFITEACEYTDSYLSLDPYIAIITTVDADHLDYFKTLENVRLSFKKFANRISPAGALVINSAIEGLNFFTEGLKCECVTYALDCDADYTASDITYDKLARGTFTCLCKGEPVGTFTLSVPGKHNVENALAAIAAARVIGISYDEIRVGLSAYKGADRRFQHIGEAFGCEIIDDYSHHPTEVRACLTTARSYPHKKIWCVFQPHTYTRTALLLDDFADALSLADEVILSDIYAAREINESGISSNDIAVRIQAAGTPASYIPDFESIASYLRDRLSPGDLLITMGAGQAYIVGQLLIKGE